MMKKLFRNFRVLGLVMALALLVSSQATAAQSAKYVFMFIGDGMALPQINAAEVYLQAVNDGKPGLQKLRLAQMPAQGLTTTYSANAFITDSAAAATALACGYKTNSGVIAMDPSKKMSYKSIAEMAKEKGMKVGIVSSVSIDHATPACFYSHEPTRKNYYEIGMALATSDFDYFAGGGLKKPTGPKKDKESAYEVARKNGFTVTRSVEEFQALKPGVGKVFAVSPKLDGDKALDYKIDGQPITLADFTEKGIELLDNPRGFFMMVEGGKIDWACHANDAGAAIQDTLAFDDAVAKALDFARQYPNDTLIVVTGDHECGGLTIGFAGTQYDSFFSVLADQKMSYIGFDKVLAGYREKTPADKADMKDLAPVVQDAFGLLVLSDEEKSTLTKMADLGDKEARAKLGMSLSDLELVQLNEAFIRSMLGEQVHAEDEYTYLMYGGYEPFTVALTHVLNHKAGLAWTSYSHTGVPVPTFAQGVGATLFQGYYDNTDVAKKVMEVMGFQPAVAGK